jgi:hypothetical protein
MTTNQSTPADRLDAFARRCGVTPTKLRTMLVQDFSRDISDKIIGYIDAAEGLEELITLVSSKRGRRFGLTLVPSYEALFDVKQYLEQLSRDPSAWPEQS